MERVELVTGLWLGTMVALFGTAILRIILRVRRR